jgi:hypothetical protein
MLEGQAKGVEHLAWWPIAGDLGEVLVLAFAIGGVADEREAEMFKVNSDLMGATGMEDGLHERGVAEAFEESIAGPGVATGSVRDRHAFTMSGMTGDGGADFALVGPETTAEHGVVCFQDAAGTELAGEGEMGSIVLCDHHAAAGVAIEAMNDAGTGDASDAAELTLAVVQEGMDKGAMIMAGGGMGHHARGFIKHEQIVIFEQNAQGNEFGFRGRGARGGPMDDDALAGLGWGSGFHGVTIDTDVAFADEALNGSA